VVGGLLFSFLNRRPPVRYQTQQVSQGNISLTVSATGPVQSSATYNLTFSGTSAKITELNVKVGQKVTAGQILARIDKTSLQDTVDQQQQAVVNAQKNLDAALASSGSSQNQSTASTDSAQTALDNAKANLAATKKTADAQKKAALNKLNQDLANCKTQATATAIPRVTPTPGVTVTPPPSSEATCEQTARDAYNLSVAQADQSVANAQAQVNSAQSSLDQAQAQSGSSNTSAQSQVVAAQAQLATAQKQLTAAQHNLDNAILKAPHNGTVTQVNGSVGGFPGASSVSSGSSSTTGGSTGGGGSGGGTFIQIVDLSTLQVQANINESDTANLKIGQPATFTVNAYGDRQFQGTVSTISPIGQTTSNVVTYPVTIDVDMNSLKNATLMPNMTANIAVTVLQRKDALLIPVNAINFARLTSSGSTTATSVQLLKKTDATTALSQARQQLADLETQNPDILTENPIPAFVVERVGEKFAAKPVVLGVSDGTNYEVLAGLSLNESFIGGAQTGFLAGNSGGNN
ncbi:MAG: efflux RND transporter periplasmic adaptor subunit, partial [Ktedonobacteraceae bacterium]|nr:efflux RND transporter periplasmic adaptor subunit [Ktedonobacteraceae bacterium]